jgi:RNA polymerase sigma-70 factor (ECF subfamily)
MRDIPAAVDGPSQTDREARDRQLMERVRAGDEGALNALLELYWTALVTYGARVLRNWDAAEDAAQETFVRIWRRRGDWERDGSVRALLFRIMRNLAFDEMKRRDRRKAWSMRRPQLESRVAMPDELLDRSELEREFDLAVASLPERRREIFLHARENGLSNREIAEVMGIATQTVANQLAAALATLRSALVPAYERPSGHRSPPPSTSPAARPAG